MAARSRTPDARRRRRGRAVEPAWTTDRQASARRRWRGSGRHEDAATAFDQCAARPGEQPLASGRGLAYSYYRRALGRQRDGDEAEAVLDLEKARQFPGTGRTLAALLRQRLTALGTDVPAEVRQFDIAVAGRFDQASSAVDLRGEFLHRHGLSRANRRRELDGIDGSSSVGVYRWAGDRNRNEQWSRLIRRLKEGDAELPALFGRILAEHVRAEPTCRAWLGEVDYVVPVPAAGARSAARGRDIVAGIAQHLCWRLRLPLRTDFLRRVEGGGRSRDVGRPQLAAQYRFNEKNAEHAARRTVMLVDDVVNRGHTVGACAALLRAHGCERIVLLVLAQAESSLQSTRHAPPDDDSGGGGRPGAL